MYVNPKKHLDPQLTYHGLLFRARVELYVLNRLHLFRELLREVACVDENGTILFIDPIFYELSRRLLYSRSMLGYGPHGVLFWGAEGISQDLQRDPAKHTFFVYFRRNCRHFGHGIPALEPWE